MRLYRALLRLYPSSFRAEYGEEMCAVFAARRRGARVPALGLWGEAVADIAVNAGRLHLDILRQDLRYTLRGLARAPIFTATVVLVAGVGIGATTAVFSLADHVLVRSLPFPDAERLVKLWQDQTSRGYTRMEFSPGNYRDVKARSTSFESMGAYTMISVNLVGAGAPERLDGAAVTPELLTLLGERAALGRTFAPSDDDPSAPQTAILSDSLWRTLFAADPSVLGRTVLLEDVPHTIVGIMPPSFHFPSRDVELWTSLRFRPDDFEARGNNYLYVVGRLRSGATLDQARAELRVIAADLERAYPTENAKTGVTPYLLSREISTQSRQMLLALSGAALCVLLIACTNLANLLLARALGRRKELALRTAIGAGGQRLFRQMLTESLVLAVLGGAAGLLVAALSAPLVARLVPNTLPIAAAPALDARMLALAASLTLLTGLGVGVVPAFRVRRGELADLREGSRAGTGRHTQRLRSLLVSAQVAACVILLVASGLLIRALWRVQNVDPGFRPDGVLTMRTWLPIPKYNRVAARHRFYRQVLSEVRALPGVTAAGYISFLPMIMRGGIWGVRIEGSIASPGETPTASLRYVTPGVFDALGVSLLRGRDVAESDTAEAPPVAVVSESFVRQHWPGADPIGRRFEFAFALRTVVGVVQDVRVRGLERSSEPQVYLSSQQVADGAIIRYTPKDLVVRASVPPSSLVSPIRAIVARADPQQPVSDVQTLSDIVAAETAPRRTQARALVVFALVALVVAAIGIHGLLAFTVSSQLREIGIRIALGARASAIVSMVLGRAAALSLAGIGGGAAAAYAAGRAMESLLFGISPADVPTFAAAALVVGATALAGSLLPAWHALRADPLAAMRTE